ncbi:MAG: thymidylate synthase [Microthrixaceae bacterium]|nr:thymidylate synthase [Microthrixaceae bacterium]
MKFEALHYAGRLDVSADSEGDVGVITLWSDRTKVQPGGRVAVVANLYGNGMYAMFCNLLNNPQIRHLVAVGIDRGLPICEEIEAFLANGVIDDEVHGVLRRRVVGTNRVFPHDPTFDVGRLREQLSFAYVGRGDMQARVDAHVATLPGLPPAGERIAVALQTDVGDDYRFLPSEVRGHQIVRSGPLAAWKELVTRTMRFGRPVPHGDEQRIELLDTKVVITDPRPESAEVLRRHGFDLAAFETYQRKLLDADPPGEVAYTYGDRLRTHFGIDALATVIDELRADPDTRHAYVSLWDTALDTPHTQGTPCLVTLFFRRSGDRLTLSATYRVHNLLNAWLQNVYGLMAVLDHVAEAVGLQAGAITVTSHSLGANPASPDYAAARALAEQWVTDEDLDEETGTRSLPEDPHGFFVVSTEDGEVVAEHWDHDGIMLRRFANARGDLLAREIVGAMAVSLPSHALWLGREIERNEHLLPRRRTTPRQPRGNRGLIVLDIGSTLVGASSLHPARRICEELGLGDDIRKPLAKALMTQLFRTPGEVSAWLESVGVDGAGDVVEATWEAQLDDAWPIEGVPEAVAALGERFDLAVLSNIWSPYLDSVRRHYPFLAEVPPERAVYSFERGTMKPDPALFGAVLGDVAPADAVMVGDTYHADLAPAMALGMGTVWVLERPEREADELTAVAVGELTAPTLSTRSLATVTVDDVESVFDRQRSARG